MKSNTLLTLAIITLVAAFGALSMNKAWLSTGLAVLAVVMLLLTYWTEELAKKAAQPSRLTFGTKRISPDGSRYEWWNGTHWLEHSDFTARLLEEAHVQDAVPPYVFFERMRDAYEVNEYIPLEAANKLANY